jgi:hypothetical protein
MSAKSHDSVTENRETWLNRAAFTLRPAFREAGVPLHGRIRISVGFSPGFEKNIGAVCGL